MLLTGLRPNADDIRKLAAELVKLAPDVILTSSSVVTSAMLHVIDPVGAGYVDRQGQKGPEARLTELLD